MKKILKKVAKAADKYCKKNSLQYFSGMVNCPICKDKKVKAFFEWSLHSGLESFTCYDCNIKWKKRFLIHKLNQTRGFIKAVKKVAKKERAQGYPFTVYKGRRLIK